MTLLVRLLPSRVVLAAAIYLQQAERRAATRAMIDSRERLRRRGLLGRGRLGVRPHADLILSFEEYGPSDPLPEYLYVCQVCRAKRYAFETRITWHMNKATVRCRWCAP